MDTASAHIRDEFENPPPPFPEMAYLIASIVILSTYVIFLFTEKYIRGNFGTFDKWDILIVAVTLVAIYIHYFIKIKHRQQSNRVISQMYYGVKAAGGGQKNKRLRTLS